MPFMLGKVTMHLVLKPYGTTWSLRGSLGEEGGSNKDD
jgi:hypothetical protein